MRSTRFHLPLPKPNALYILALELPAILVFAVGLFICFLTDYRADPLSASFRYPEQFQSVTASLLVAVGTAIIADLVEREQAQ